MTSLNNTTLYCISGVENKIIYFAGHWAWKAARWREYFE